MDRCPKCDADWEKEPPTGCEYAYGSPERYDGVSEWWCKCGARIGRWTGKVLDEGEIEPRYGRMA